MKKFQICTNCVMDTSDPQITFDKYGVCDHCNGFYRDVLPYWHPNHYGRILIDKLADQIRESGAGKEYDCIMGLSGGLDSSYLLHLAVTVLKLRPLVFHVDGGWNTEIAVNNIGAITESLDSIYILK